MQAVNEFKKLLGIEILQFSYLLFAHHAISSMPYTKVYILLVTYFLELQ